MSDDTPAAPKFHLRTFGTLQLTGSADETVLGDHGHQRRRLALLAVLAAAGERGRSRDQLLGLFWPDVSQARARHSLEQLIYAIRTSLDGNVFVGLNPVRLNSAFISSDIADFENALARGELEAATELYRGRFLEGFYLSDTPEFEQWMDAERGRIERSYIEALERLAKNAEDAGDFMAAARWRQKLIDADPVSSKHAIALIRALMNAGDHPAALQFAERYEATVAQELGTGVGPAVAAVVAEVRQRAKSESVVVRGAPPPPKRHAYANSTPTLTHDAAPGDTADAVTAADESLIWKREPIASPFGSQRRMSGLYAIAALMLVAVVAYAIWTRTPGNVVPPSVSDSSIAVLPLTNVSGSASDAAFVDGLTEELIGVLAKIHRLRVVARTSAFAFRNSNLDVRRIADSLRVANLLEGSVQKVGEKLRVQVRLIDARDGSTRWSETYDRDAKDVFLVQSQIATAVAHELDLRLGEGTVAALRREPTENIAAHELYLRGNDPALLRSDSAALTALNYFRQAVALDSTYAAAYAGMARMYLRLRSAELPGVSTRGFKTLAEQAASKAVSLDDSLAEAHAVVGLVHQGAYDVVTAEKELLRAVALDPANSRTHEWLSFLYSSMDRPADALAEANRAVENDPLSPSAHAEVGRALCATGQVDQGLARLRSLDSVRPPLARAALYKALCYEKNRNWTAAASALSKTVAGGPAPPLLGHALAHAGQREKALSILAELTNHWRRTNDGAFGIAVVYAGLGDRERAFEWLEQSVHDAGLYATLLQPLFDDLAADPRLAEFRRRHGLQKR